MSRPLICCTRHSALLALRCATTVRVFGAEGLVILYEFCRGYEVVRLIEKLLKVYLK